MEKKNKITIKNFFNIYWCFINDKILITTLTKEKQEYYILLPKNVSIFKKTNVYFLKTENNLNCFFSRFFSKWIENFYKPFQKKLFFKGLGFKFNYINEKKILLELKMGFSHLIFIKIPHEKLKVFLIKKNRIVIEGFSPFIIGNFAQKIRNLRFPDSYNGKGFWYKNEFRLLKPVKKT